MKASIGYTLIAICKAIPIAASLFAATSLPLGATEFSARYPAAQEEPMENPAQDYIRSFGGKPFIASRRDSYSEVNPSRDPGRAYIDSFTTHDMHVASPSSSMSTPEALERPSTLISR